MIKKIGYSILALIIVLVLLIIFLVDTQPGLKTTLWLAEKILPGQLIVVQPQGRIISHLRFAELRYTNDDTRIKMGNFELVWNGFNLLTGRVNITNLSAYKINVHLPKSTKETKKKSQSSFKLPLQFTLKHIDINKIKITQGDKTPFEIQSIKIENTKSQKNNIIIQSLQLTSKPYALQAKGNVSLDLKGKTQLTCQFTHTIKDHPTLTAHLLATGHNDNIKIAITTGAPYAASISAKLTHVFQHGPIEADGEWPAITWPISKTNLVHINQGRFALNGTLDHYQLNFKSHLSGTKIPSTVIELTGQGNTQQFQIKNLMAQLLGGTINSFGTISWHDGFQWQTTSTVSHINPAMKFHCWQGDINLTLHSSGDLAHNSKIHIDMPNIFGNINGKPLKGIIQADSFNQLWTIKQFQLSLGKNHLAIKGQVNDNSHLTWDVNATDLNDVMPSFTGSLVSQGQLRGSIQHPDISATLTANHLRIDNISAKNLQANIHYQWQNHREANADITGSNIGMNALNISQFTLHANGNDQQQRINLHARSNLGSIDLASSGFLKNSIWHGVMQTLNLHTQDYGHWQLAQPLHAKYDQALDIKHFCLNSQYGDICARGQYESPANWSGDVSVEKFNAALAQHLLPSGYSLNSRINLQSHIQRQKKRITGNLKLNIHHLNAHAVISDKTIQFNIRNSQFNASISSKGITSQFTLQAPQQQIRITGRANLPNYRGKGMPNMNDTVAGNISLHIANLNLVKNFVPQVDNLGGNISGRASFSGKLLNPNISGQVSLNNAFVDMEKLGIKYRNIQLTLNAQHSDKVNIKGSIQSAGSTLFLNGQTILSPSFSPSTLYIKGNNFLAVNSKEYQIYLSPDLKIKYDQPKLIIDGSILIPKTLIRPQDFTSTTELPDTVTVIRKNTPQKKSTPLKIKSNIKVTLGDSVRLEYAGLFAELAGSVNVRLLPDGITSASGNINVTKGGYDAYGQKLNIQHGNLIFTGGPIDNPGINILATKTIHVDNASASYASTQSQIVTGIQVTGTLNHPKISLYSSPTMNSDNTLSYLVLGQPAGQASGASLQVLSTAAQAMGLTGGSITGDLKKGLGLSQFGVESSQIYNPDRGGTESQSSFVVGKQLTKRISLSYSVGILLPINILKLRYQIAQNWAAETNTSTYGQGADIFYTIETN